MNMNVKMIKWVKQLIIEKTNMNKKIDCSIIVQMIFLKNKRKLIK